MNQKLRMIDADKVAYSEMCNSSSAAAENLLYELKLDWTYHSNAIEGNTLSLLETKEVIAGSKIGGKSQVEHLEALNHWGAITFVNELVVAKEELSEWHIRNIHALVLKDIENDEAGRYRRENVTIAGAGTTPPHFMHLNEEMAQLIYWNANAVEMHPIERAAELHTRFVEIHPFFDGNGRTGRLLLNFELMKSGYPPAVILKEDKFEYYNALNKACLSRNYDAITNMIANALESSIRRFLI